MWVLGLTPYKLWVSPRAAGFWQPLPLFEDHKYRAHHHGEPDEIVPAQAFFRYSTEKTENTTSVMASWIVLSCAVENSYEPMRFAGTWKQYSANAITQLTTMTLKSGASRCRRWPYHANVMKILERVSKRMVVIFLVDRLTDVEFPAGFSNSFSGRLPVSHCVPAAPCKHRRPPAAAAP